MLVIDLGNTMYARWRISFEVDGLLEERRQMAMWRKAMQRPEAVRVAHVEETASAPDLLTREPLWRSFLGVTVREAEVIGWVAKGLTNKAIASQLQISSRTVQKHMERMFRKLDVRSRTELVARIYMDIGRNHNGQEYKTKE
jgi:DNA-binding NarL/FixJ family response regulator